MGKQEGRRVHPLTVETALLYSPVELDLKLVKAGPGGALKPRRSGEHFRRLGDQIQRLLGGRFTSFRSSPTGVYSKGVNSSSEKYNERVNDF